MDIYDLIDEAIQPWPKDDDAIDMIARCMQRQDPEIRPHYGRENFTVEEPIPPGFANTYIPVEPQEES